MMRLKKLQHKYLKTPEGGIKGITMGGDKKFKKTP